MKMQGFALAVMKLALHIRGVNFVERMYAKMKIKNKLSNPIIKFLIKITFIVLLIIAALIYVIQVHRATGNENSPFVRDGDLCVFNRLSSINVNDVVIYKSPDGNLKIGRIVAVGGQAVDMDDTGIYKVNGYIPEEEITYPTKKSKKNKIKYPLTVGKNEYFILNDFRTLTSDSREYGVISKKDINGTLLLLFRRRSF